MDGILGTILGGVASIGTGGITALLGIGVGKVFDWLNAREARETLKVQNQHELDMKRADADLMDREWRGRVEVATTEADATKDKAASDAFARSYETENKPLIAPVAAPEGGKVASFTRGIGWLTMAALEFIRGVIRPGLTIYLAVICTMMYVQAQTVLAFMADGLRNELMGDVYKALVYTFLYLFTTAFLWWFGTRNSQTAPKLSR